MAVKERFHFIDQFRGLVGVMMALGHSNEYFNHIWYAFKFQDPFFASGAQFGLRYMGYLCAPGFLVMNGAMVYWAYTRRIKAGHKDWRARWDFIERGLFLIAVQMIWVNASWGGFSRIRIWHWSIIACIGTAMILLTLVIKWRWQARLALGAALIFGQHFLLKIPGALEDRFPVAYDAWLHVPMEMFITSGSFNLYPALPWFGLALVGSVMAHFWFEGWKTHAERSTKSMIIGVTLVAVALLLRLNAGYGNILPWTGVGTWSFFLEQKYPPNVVHLVWFAGAVIFMVGLFCRISMHSNILKPLGIIGKVPLFFYVVHIPLLAIITKRLGFFYREGAVIASFVGWLCLLAVMFPLAIWFGRVKRRSKNHFIKLM